MSRRWKRRLRRPARNAATIAGIAVGLPLMVMVQLGTLVLSAALVLVWWPLRVTGMIVVMLLLPGRGR